jgi:aryl-alcohol dehydrogenase-like predicted oxidoreductase
MKSRELGSGGPSVSAIGLGALSLSGVYGDRLDEAEAHAFLSRAIDVGVTFWDTADIYDRGHNEKLLGGFLKGRRHQVFLGTKFGGTRTGPNGSPEYVAEAVERSLTRLNTDVIDLYYLHRPDNDRPIEETVGAMANLVKQGKVRYLGLSEVSAKTLERACKVHQIAALQSEYSLWTRDPEKSVMDACERLGVGFVPFCPLGRGFLTGTVTNTESFGEKDYRNNVPRFQGEQFKRNLLLADQFKAIATDKGVSAAQLALAWVLARNPHIVPIPGTRRIKYLEENSAATDVELIAEDLAKIDKLFPVDLDVGARYPEAMMAMTNS